jgi:hypothetical protein
LITNRIRAWVGSRVGVAVDKISQNHLTHLRSSRYCWKTLGCVPGQYCRRYDHSEQ